MKKYIIDTDIGDDIDDAFALDLALKLELDLVCVTTVFRDTRSRAAIAKKLLSLCGKNIPVYAGFGKTLDGKDERTRLCQWTPDLESGRYAPDNSSPEEAVDAILSAARRYKENFYLIAIGPLTNVASAILKDREAMKGIGGVIMMGGDYVNQYAEWNIHCDVSAADVVFSSGVKIVAFGHEITSRTRLTRAQQEYVFSMKQDARHAYLAELSRLWYKSKPEGWLIVLHDVLVIRYAADPSFCKTAFAPVAVERTGRYTAGMTVNLSKMDLLSVPRTHGIEYATETDVPAFIEYFMNEIGCQAEGGKNHEKDAENGDKLLLAWNARGCCDGLR